MPPPAEQVWRDGGVEGEAAKAVGREEAAESAVGRSGTGQSGRSGSVVGKLTSPGRRREAVWEVQDRLGVSKRWVYRALGQPRVTRGHRPLPRQSPRRLVSRLLQLVRQHPLYDYRRIWTSSRPKWVACQSQGHPSAAAPAGAESAALGRQKRHWWQSANGAGRRAELKHHVWAWDYIHDRTCNGGPLKWLTLVDQ